MNYKKYVKAQELDIEIKKAEEQIGKIDAFAEKIDEVEDSTAMIMIGYNRLYFDKDIAKIFLQFANKFMRENLECMKEEFKKL